MVSKDEINIISIIIGHVKICEKGWVIYIYIYIIKVKIERRDY